MTRSQLTSTVEQNSGGAVTPFTAGKNAIINGDFKVWQRGTSGTSSYVVDRWRYDLDGTGGTVTQSQQTFTAGSAPVSGYEGTYYLRFGCSSARSGQTYNVLNTRLEDVRLFAGQTVTLSYWARVNTGSGSNFSTDIVQNFGSGGSASVTTSPGAGATLTSSWARYSQTFTIPSISGKTIGTNSFLEVDFNLTANTATVIDLWGVQLEPGAVATPFSLSTSSPANELLACQRYYVRYTGGFDYPVGVCFSTTTARFPMPLPTNLRSSPTVVDYSNVYGRNNAFSVIGPSSSAPTVQSFSGNFVIFDVAFTTGSFTIGYSTYLIFSQSGGGYIGFGAEL